MWMNMSWVWQQINRAALWEDLSMIGGLEGASQVAWLGTESKGRKPERSYSLFQQMFTEHHLCAKHPTKSDTAFAFVIIRRRKWFFSAEWVKILWESRSYSVLLWMKKSRNASQESGSWSEPWWVSRISMDREVWGKGVVQAEGTESKRIEGPFLQKQLSRET